MTVPALGGQAPREFFSALRVPPEQDPEGEARRDGRLQ
jgi:hypothetical protein